MTRDWVQWHRDYDEPTSSLAWRLRVVRHYLREALDGHQPGDPGELRLISICAGDGRDVLPVLSTTRIASPVRALLVELDPILARRARATAEELKLPLVGVRTADAGVARGREEGGTDPCLAIREWFAEHGFTEMSFTAPVDAGFRVGMHRLDGVAAKPIMPGTPMFSFR